jgi:hypothetical protein
MLVQQRLEQAQEALHDKLQGYYMCCQWLQEMLVQELQPEGRLLQVLVDRLQGLLLEMLVMLEMLRLQCMLG